MPRFSDSERALIGNALLDEGERLFSVHGLKKVTVDDLAEAANISKGSFYAFYQSKEHLFMAINFRIQDRLFSELRQELEANKSLPPKELARQTILSLYEKAAHNPILQSIDKATMQLLRRKLPHELLADHTQDDAAMVGMLADYGIHFHEDITLVAKALQTLMACSNLLLEDEDNSKVMNILIGGILNLID